MKLVSARAGSAAPRRVGWVRRHAAPLTLFTAVLILNLVGLSYYMQPLAGKVRSPYHPWLKPTGTIGQSVGILAFVLFLLLWLYPLRKKFRWLAFTGSMSRWLDVHIVVGVLVPWLAAIHAGFRFDGLIGLGYFSMVMVAISGLIGKYLYVRIPRGRSGLELNLSEIKERQKALEQQIAASLSLPPEEVEAALDAATAAVRNPRRGWGMLGLISNDFARWRTVRALRLRWRGMVPRGSGIRKAALDEVIRLARRRIALSQQMKTLDKTQRIFRYWHVAHRPVAVTALLAVVIHVGVAVALGVSWFG